MYVTCVGLVFVTLATMKQKRYCIDTSFENETLKGINEGCDIDCTNSTMYSRQC